MNKCSLDWINDQYLTGLAVDKYRSLKTEEVRNSSVVASTLKGGKGLVKREKLI